jgi:hypothetical protein
MSSSTQFPTNINVQNIRFYNGTELGSTNTFTDDVRCKKRLRVENNLDVRGKIPYVDNQTGWGLPQWTYAATTGYNVTTDSLIAKIKIIEDSYATKTYVDSGGQFSTAQGIVYYATNSFFVYNDPTLKYQYPITTLAANTGFIIRDINGTTMTFKFQKGNIGIGKVLGCIDTDGTVGWVAPTDGTLTQATSVTTSNGTSNNYSFRVVDTGLTTTEGIAFYPDMLDDSFNKGIKNRDHVFLGGTFENKSAINRVFIGPYSEGSDGVAIENTRTQNGILTQGKTIITGGYYTLNADQRVSLASDGIKLQPAPNLPLIAQIPHQAKNLSASPRMFRKSLLVTTTFAATDEYPLLLMTKNGQFQGVVENHGIGMFCKLNNTFYNPLVSTNANGIISAEWGNFLTNGDRLTIIPEAIQLFVGPLSSYADGFTVSPNIASEINNSSVGGYTQMTSFDSQNYIQVNKNGIVQLTGGSRKMTHYGAFEIINKSGSIFNNTNTSSISSSLQVGTTSSPVTSNFYGNFNVAFGELYLQPTGSPLVNGNYLKCTTETGKAEWGQLPSSYSALDVTTITGTSLTANTISLSYSNGSTAAISLQKSSIFQGLNDKYLHFDNNFVNGEIVFAVRDSNNNQQIPVSINSGGLQISTGKALAYPDNSVQTSAYTGAKGLNGSYTYCNITINDQGKITAISSNPSTSIPSSITTPISFTGGATFSTEDTTFNSAINAYSSLNVVGKLSFNDFNSVNIMRSESISADGFFFTQNTNTFAPNSYYGYNQGEYAGNLNGAGNNFPQGTWLYGRSDPVNIGTFTIPANYNNRIQINIPVKLINRWCFRGDIELSNEGGITFDYYIERILVKLFLNGVEYTGFEYFNSAQHSSHDLGYFFVKYERNVRNNNQGDGYGPNDDKHVMYQEFNISNPSIQFTLPKETSNRTYQISVSVDWSFIYNSYGGSENDAKNYYGNNQTDHYFAPFDVLFVQSSSSTWLSYVTNYNNNPPNTTSQYNQYFKNFKWSRPYYPDSNNYSWGTYYGNLPWGQVSLLNFDQIYTNKKVLCGVGQFGSLYIKGDTQSTGLMQCRGYMGRPGLGSNNSNTLCSYADMFQHNALTSTNWMNSFWTGSKLDFYVDFTLVLSQSPNYSDYRIKSNLQESPPTLDGICKTTIYQYDIDHELYHDRCRTGIIAHEMQQNLPLFPRLIYGTKDAVDREGKIIPQSLDYNELTIILMKGIQELKIENDQLKEHISTLESKLSHLYLMVESLLSHQLN